MELQLKLNQFQGPLDLLLHLLDKDQIDIQDIFISDITEQYLAYVADISQLDMENASEFLVVAAQLLEIKSSSLLPKPAPLEEGEEDPEEAFKRRLAEYKLFKEASQELQQKEEQNLGVYYKLPEEIHLDARIELEDMHLDALMDAFKEVLRRVESKTAPQKSRDIVRDRYTVKGKMSHIRRRLASKKEVSFFELFEDDGNKSEVVTTFAAMLELWKNRFLNLEQKQAFGDIRVRLNVEDTNNAENNGDITDEY